MHVYILIPCVVLFDFFYSDMQYKEYLTEGERQKSFPSLSKAHCSFGSQQISRIPCNTVLAHPASNYKEAGKK